VRGEPAIAQAYPERCLAISEQHGFRQWLGLSRAIRGICAAALDASGRRLDDVKAALDEYQRAGYQLGITAQFVLLCPVLLLRNENEAALEVIARVAPVASDQAAPLDVPRLSAILFLSGGIDSSAIVALLKQLVALVGFLIVAIKVVVVVIFIALIVLIGLAIWRERCNRRRDRDEL
jgi:hypothetical protein